MLQEFDRMVDVDYERPLLALFVVISVIPTLAASATHFHLRVHLHNVSLAHIFSSTKQKAKCALALISQRIKHRIF